MNKLELIELTEEQLSKVKGGGTWVYRDGQWFYLNGEDI